MLKLFVKEIIDNYVRDNFKKLQDFFTFNELLNTSFKHFEIDFKNDNETIKVAHGFKFVPSDIFITWTKFISTVGTITINYDSFDTENISITSTKPCKIRGFMGRYTGKI